MAAAVEATARFKLAIRETQALGQAGATDPIINYEVGDVVDNVFVAGSAVKVSKHYYNKAIAVDGSDLDDLTALAGPSGTTVDFSGLAIQFIKIFNPAANALLTITEAVSNGYELLGGTGDIITVHPGGTYLIGQANGLADVDETHKALLVAGTGSETFEIELVAGATS